MQQTIMLTFTPESLTALIDERIQEALDQHTATISMRGCAANKNKEEFKWKSKQKTSKQ